MRSLARRATGLVAAYAVALQALLVSWAPVAMPSALGADAALCLTDFSVPDGSRPDDPHRVCAAACVVAASGGVSVERVAEPALPPRHVMPIAWHFAAEVLPAARGHHAALPRGPPAA